MEHQKFSNVFKKITISKNLKDLFWDTYVKKVSISKASRSMEIELLSMVFISGADVLLLQKELMGHFKEASGVNVKMEYDLPYKDNLKKLSEVVKEDICFSFKTNKPITSAILNAADWKIEDKRLTIALKSKNAYLMRINGTESRIAKIMRESYSADLSLRFADGVNEQITDYHKPEQPLYIPRDIGGETPQNQTVRRVTRKAGAGVVGKSIKGVITPVSEARNQGEKLIIEGNILSVEKRDIKGEKVLVKFDITDFTDSTTVIFFLKKDKFDEISDSFTKGNRLRVEGEVQYDKYSNELNIMAKNIEKLEALPEKTDDAAEKRVELHLHTQMSQMDAVTSTKALIERAAKWGHKAIAITDHGVVQAFPDAMDAAKKHGIKVIYGMEGYLVNDLGSVVQMPKGQTLDDTFVVFDIETTGLYKERDKITEIGAVKIKSGEIVDRFSTFVDPGIPIPQKIVELTGITDDMVRGAPPQKAAVKLFLEFVGDAVLVAHNASFDMGFISYVAAKKNIEVNNTVLDTVELSRALFPQLTRHKLNDVCKHLEISLENHHRAVDDAEAAAQILLKSFEILKQSGVTDISEINVVAAESGNFKKLKTYHVIILAQNQKGLKNLYELVSKSSIDYYFKRPRIPKSLLQKKREGLIIGSACEAGELYNAILDGRPEEVIRQKASFYDYFEIQPLGNNKFLVDSGKLGKTSDLIDINKKIISLGEDMGKPVVATCDVHFMNPEDEIFRRIIMKGGGFSDADNQPPLYFRTTNEMLKEFNYLEPQKAYEVVIKNTNMIADMIEDVLPIPKELYPPEIEGAEETLRQIVMDKAHSIYGENLPVIVSERLERELNSIINNGFSVMYIIAQKLVWNSVDNGYLVGSRGSVGSSFAATMAGITEVNPLSPHYVCEKCKYSDFDSEDVIAFAGGSGCDMPDKDCPKCGTKMKKDGHDIPFETFLGFDGDKEPDIDLNFSGEYQQNAHMYTEELFGSDNVFKAGTIGTLAEKTAYGYVKKYYDEKGITKHNAEINRLVAGCTGIKKTTGQHPGGLMVVPRTQDIHNFTPVQRPANDMNSTITTTHFDYHSISGRLLKLDILGHDDPTVIRMLYDLTGVNPQFVSLDDKETMSLFTSTKALGVTSKDINSETGTIGLPEFGTKFVRQMLMETKPTTFAELVRIAGLSHGTDVWINNAQVYVKEGKASLKDIISTRDDIMVYLIIMGVEKKTSFQIMEDVRKGKGVKPEYAEIMRQNNVPDWYIESCNKIKYMFPKAHAAAYVMMSFRIAYFKVHYPVAFYTSYFTVRADDFDYVTMCKGEEAAKAAMTDLEQKGGAMTAKEERKLIILEVVYEMYKRGIRFVPLDLYKSEAARFLVCDDGIRPPLNAIPGLGVTAAESIVEARKSGEFLNVEELRERTSISKTVIELLIENKILAGMPMTSQLTLFTDEFDFSTV